MKTTSSPVKLKTRNVKDYIPVIQNAEELFELYTINIHLEILKDALQKKRGSVYDDAKIMAEINLASELQEMCRRRV
jgi:hypothetical protein